MSKIEKCAVCNAAFSTPRAGDKHRVLVSKYSLFRVSGSLVRVPLGAARPRGGQLVSEGNEQRRCLTAEEMRGIGMNQEKNGVWNSGGNWIGASWK